MGIGSREYICINARAAIDPSAYKTAIFRLATRKVGWSSGTVPTAWALSSKKLTIAVTWAAKYHAMYSFYTLSDIGVGTRQNLQIQLVRDPTDGSDNLVGDAQVASIIATPAIYAW